MNPSSSSSKKFNVAMVCDFFYPRLGGVEMHMFQLALCLIERGHKVIIITHSYDNRQGVRYVTHGLKVYYCPISPFVDQATFPNFLGFFPLFRKIIIREKIQIVHAHQATSTLGHECIFHSRTMGLKTIYTDHSLFGFADAACIHLNKMLKIFLSDIDHAISVSHTSRENLSLRASLNPYNISVIPNAVDCSRFTPDPSKRFPLNTINIVILSRLTFRKGIDLLVDVIPEICAKFPEVYFIIAGDGPKRKILEYTIEKNNLQNRAEFLGSVSHKEVRNVMIRGHIYLNSSLTEAFCIAIVEAASSGLLVVSTNVGGITEVLPHDMIYLANPNPKDLIKKLEEAIPKAKNIPTHKFHEKVKNLYNWRDVAMRTEKVYEKVISLPQPTIQERMKRYYSSGPYAGIIALLLMIVDIFLYILLLFFSPTRNIDIAVEFPIREYNENKDKYGDHLFNLLEKKKKNC